MCRVAECGDDFSGRRCAVEDEGRDPVGAVPETFAPAASMARAKAPALLPRPKTKRSAGDVTGGAA
jgi:hypothetical protein